MAFSTRKSLTLERWLLTQCRAFHLLTTFSRAFSRSHMCLLLSESLSAGIVPAAFKSVYICPVIKNPDLNTTDVKNYRCTVSACGVDVAGEAGRSAAALLVVSQQAAAQLAICIWSLQVHWDCHLWHFVNVRYWWHSCSNSTRFIRGFRHRRPDNSAATSAYFIWSERRCVVVVPFDHLTPASTACVSLRQAVSAVCCSVRHTTRVRTGPLLFVMYTADTVSIVECQGLSGVSRLTTCKCTVIVVQTTQRRSIVTFTAALPAGWA